MGVPGNAGEDSLEPQLAALAARLGIEASYWDLTGKRRVTSPATARALCAGMGFEAQTEARAAESCQRFDRARSDRLLEPVRVWRQHASCAPDLRVRHPGGGPWRVQIRVLDEQGELRERSGELPGASAGSLVSLALPGSFEPGVHEVELLLALGTREQRAQQRLVIAPRTALRSVDKLGQRRVAGLWTNLYSVRGERSFGFGDCGDLGAIARACGAAGGDFLGVNPMHAAPLASGGVSPYSPVSRFFRNPLYIEVEAVPELADCEGARRVLETDAMQATRGALRAADRLDCAAVFDAKAPVLRELHRAFAAGASPQRRARFEAFCRRVGTELASFATFVVAAEEPGCAGKSWQQWPAELRDPRASAEGRFRERHAQAIDFQMWLQFELDEQLASVARSCRESGQAIGLYFDLAVGSARDSADTWSLRDRHAQGVSIGAPPDAYAPEGQVWGLPPFDPNALRREGFETWRRLLDASFRHAGALRIDHVMGLQRQFWVPDGGTAADGAYVRFPLDELLGVLALESQRHEALVIGEDLGTVPSGLSDTLASWGVLSSSVYIFERAGSAFPSPDRLSSRALATIGTHDMPPLAGYEVGRDLELRRAAGAIASDDALHAAQDARREELAALKGRLRDEGLIGDASSDLDLRRALAELLGRSPAPLVGISLDDVAGESEPINLPGVPVEVHPSWARRMSSELCELLEPERLRAELPQSRLRSATRRGR